VIYPYARFGCNLELSSFVTQQYLNPVCDPLSGVDPICGSSPRWEKAIINCACESDNWIMPNDLLTGTPTEKAALTTPALDNAEWYDVDIPESAGFLGFMIEDVDGMGATGTRSVTSKATSSGGGVLGPYRKKERSLKFKVLLFACNESSMEYGFRYLISQLSGGPCSDGCELCDAEISTCCTSFADPLQPTVEELETGRWQIKDFGLVDGPKWAESPVEELSCFVRRAEFTIVSESPWLHKCPRFCLEDEPLFPALADPCDIEEWLCNPAEVSCVVDENKIIGETAVGVIIHANENLTNVNITVTADPFGYVCDPSTAPADYIPGTVPPCIVINIPNIPDGYIFNFDSVNEKITVANPGGQVVDGTSYLSVIDGVAPTWAYVSCGAFCVSVTAIRCHPGVGDTTVSITSTHREM
jgi:hypothetical protein